MRVNNPEERDRFDNARTNRASQAEPPPQAAPRSRASLREALQGLEFNGEPFERVFVAPHIPLKKLHGALHNYGQGLRPNDVIVLIDNTLFGGAGEGVLITEMEIRHKAPFERLDERLLGCLSDIRAEGKYVYIHGERYAELNMPDERDLEQLFQAVTRYLQETD